MYYVYVWSDQKGLPFYVGKGSGRRAFDVRKRSREFNAIYEQGQCSVEILDWFIHESQAHAREMELISLYGRKELGGPLVNKTDGGEGLSGFIVSDKTRKRRSEALRGKPKSPEHVAKMAASKRGSKHTEETKAMMSKVRKGRTIPIEIRLKMSAAQKGNPPTEACILALKKRKGIKRPEWAVENSNQAIRLLPPRGKSGFKGVTYRDRDRCWYAKIKSKGRHIYLGTFQSAESAARAYDAAAIDLWGVGNCYLNFPYDYIANDNQSLLSEVKAA